MRGIRQRVADPRLCGEMNDPCGTMSREELLHPGAIGDIQPHEAETRIGTQQIEPRLLQRRIVVVIEVVEPDHFVAALEELAGYVIADEAGRAGHEDHRIARTGSAPFGVRTVMAVGV